MKILSIGSFNGLSNTCLHRNWALKEIAEEIDMVNIREKQTSWLYRVANWLFQKGLPIPLPDDSNANKKINAFVKKSVNRPYDIVWIDKGLMINPDTLRNIKKVSPSTRIVSYSPDNMVLRHNQSLNYLKGISLYDIHFTTKSYVIDKLKGLGARRAVFTNKHYEHTFHYPRDLSKEELDRLGGDVGFIGIWEQERCDSILFLAKNGIKVKVYGGGKWQEYNNIENLEILPAVYSEDYSKALQAFKISLCFLRKINADLQTSRSMEIPACGGFMLAERTSEHLELFSEGLEAEFFSSNSELLQKCRYYLQHENERKQIAIGGVARCETSGYSNRDAVKRMLEIVQLNG
ncbi:glycosyltransferase [Sphingobacterium sp. lm-10]|uniref:CgeB family protein n=1 Tax=Sphingobacterium sp. lm-10 TaxID=2944904 RepID=UPI0020224AC6|nr:glycosyltransferase [Sphingobacterium sp. lm-10]MCL7988649.1 glycosyltransferase [Sphingobacterium sp. lm-10]